MTSFSFYLRFAYAGYNISREGTYSEINAIKVSTPNALKSKSSTKENRRVYHPKADDSFDINIDSENPHSFQSSQSGSSLSSQQSSLSQSSKSEEHSDAKRDSQNQSNATSQSADNREPNQQSQNNNTNTNNQQGQDQDNQQPASDQSHWK